MFWISVELLQKFLCRTAHYGQIKKKKNRHHFNFLANENDWHFLIPWILDLLFRINCLYCEQELWLPKVCNSLIISSLIMFSFLTSHTCKKLPPSSFTENRSCAQLEVNSSTALRAMDESLVCPFMRALKSHFLRSCSGLLYRSVVATATH